MGEGEGGGTYGAEGTAVVFFRAHNGRRARSGQAEIARRVHSPTPCYALPYALHWISHGPFPSIAATGSIRRERSISSDEEEPKPHLAAYTLNTAAILDVTLLQGGDRFAHIPPSHPVRLRARVSRGTSPLSGSAHGQNYPDHPGNPKGHQPRN